MARILLIKATRSLDEALMSYSPPLGLLYLIAYLRKHRPQDEFKLVDERIARHSDDDFSQLVSDFRPDFVGISSQTVEAHNANKYAQLTKKLFPKTPVILGGPYATSFETKALKEPSIDYVVAGEGEAPLLRLINSLEADDRFPEIPGLILRDKNGEVRCYPQSILIADLDELPFPAWEHIDFDQYANRFRMTPIGRGKYALLFTSRGCPYECIYCHNIFGRRYRAMSPKRAVDEIEYLVNSFGINEFEIVDDSFNLDYKRTEKICDEIVARGLKVRLCFPNGLRTDLLDENLIKKLRKAGTIHMAIAVESASERIQKLIKKKLNLKKVKKNIEIAAREGIFTWGFFMIGFPDETREELFETFKFALSSKLQGAYFFLVIPQEGTELAKLFETSPLSERDDLHFSDYFTMENKLSQITPRELWMWQVLGSIAFHYYPPRIVSIIKNYPYGYRQLIRKGFRFTFVFTYDIIAKNFIKRTLKAQIKSVDNENG
ncbi:MAG: radical SAM protein [Myxococcota bacterium]